MNADDSVDVAAARAICDSATPGPWEHELDQSDARSGYDVYVPDANFFYVAVGDHCGAIKREADAEFITAARSGWPAALDVNDSLRADNAVLRAALDRVTALCDHTSDFIGEYVCVATVRDAATVSPAPETPE